MRHTLHTLSIALAITATAQKSPAYKSFPNDPLGVRVYTLKNGLQVWLSRNTDAPRIQTWIAVRAGSKYDPADATGLAHYLEHMLFKGTSHIATANWPEESRLLQQISDLYEKRRGVTDEQERARIYRDIDSLSAAAARLAIPNEYDKMITTLGARGTNAFTSTERTVYVNDIPSEELERWMSVEAERFRECVLRLFHTELETVYEEFNRAQDNDGRTAGKAMNELLYPRHPYGTQTTIGTGEHLKNPSMEKIQAYFRTYYVPNNMAIVLSGDLDYDRTVAMVDKYFGTYSGAPVPPFKFAGEEPIAAPRVTEVFGPQAAWVDVAWRFPGYDAERAVMLELVSGLLSNGRAGLLDLDLVQAQQVLSAYAYGYPQADFSELGMHAVPREGQTLEQARQLLLDEVEKLCNGHFEPWLIQAVADNLRLTRSRSWTESDRSRVSAMTDAFILNKDWKDVLAMPDRIAAITTKQVTDWCRANLGGGHCTVYKRTGENPNVHKVAKPPITQLDINRSETSAWRKEWEKMPGGSLSPVFVDYTKAIERRRATTGPPVFHVHNGVNELFSLYYIVEMGSDHDRELPIAVRYLPYLGTGKRSAAQLKQDLYRMGLRLDVSATEDRVYVTLSGLEKNMASGIDLLEELLADPQPDARALEELVNDILKQRQDNMKNKTVVLNRALFNRARYGAVNPFNDVLTEDQLRGLSAEAMVAKIKDLTGHMHRVFHYGSTTMDQVSSLLAARHKVPAQLKAIPAPRPYMEQETRRNLVLVSDFDMVQAEMIMVNKSVPFDAARMPYAALFNEYFGSGLSSIVFQEIREAKALAYGASASYTTPVKSDEAHYLRGFIGTQADKLGDAVDALLKLMNDMPVDEQQFAGARESALKAIASERINREQLFWNWDAAQRRGLNHDIRKDIYEQLPSITVQDLKAFFDANVKGHAYTYCVIGRADKLDRAALEKLGPVQDVSKEELFGYPQLKR